MAIIYSYPTEATPTTSDLLLGTSIENDSKPTKTFTIASLAALVSANAGTGTVTGVSTANSTFINMTGGTINVSGTLQASLSASGTPSNATFLRGDNTWSPATSTGSPNVAILDELTTITSAATSINFTGAGVTGNAVGNDVTISIPAATSAVTSINVAAQDGISVNQSTGDVEVTNTGVLSLTAGSNITLSGTTGNVVINAQNNPGTVQSILPGNGLQLDSGVLTANPTIGVEYEGSNNYILVKSSAAAPTLNDFIPFSQLSSSAVKTSTFGTIPMAALPLVQSYIDTGDENTVSNSTDDKVTTAKITNVITLTSVEYSGITPDPGTLYIITPASTSYTVTLSPVTNNIIDATPGAPNYTITGNVSGDTIDGIAGEPYEFITTVTPGAGYYFSTPVSGNVVSGTIASTTAVGQTLAGELKAVPSPAIVATLLVVTDIQGGPASEYTIAGDLTGATQRGGSYTFATTCTLNGGSGYTFTSGPTITNATGTITGSQTVVTTITGTLALS